MFDHPHLGILSDEEYRYMRQRPIGMPDGVQWSAERLREVRAVISGGSSSQTLPERSSVQQDSIQSSPPNVQDPR